MSTEAGRQHAPSDAPCAGSMLPLEPVTVGRSWLGLRLLLLTALVAGAAILFLVFDLHHQLTEQTLRDHRTMLLGWVERWPVLAPVVFAAVYAFAVLFIPPSGTVMTAMAGFLFGSVLGSVVAVVGATTGATFVFLTARFLAGNIVRRKVAPAVRFMQTGFRHHAFSYMLMLRLLPLFPFWLVNLATAFLHVPLRTFIFATFLGIIPVTVVFAMFGAGLGAVLDRNQPISLDGVLTPQILAGLLALAVLALLPVFYRRRKMQMRTTCEEEQTTCDDITAR